MYICLCGAFLSILRAAASVSVTLFCCVTILSMWPSCVSFLCCSFAILSVLTSFVSVFVFCCYLCLLFCVVLSHLEITLLVGWALNTNNLFYHPFYISIICVCFFVLLSILYQHHLCLFLCISVLPSFLYQHRLSLCVDVLLSFLY